MAAKLNKIAKDGSLSNSSSASAHQDQKNKLSEPLMKPFRPRETPLITRKWKQARKIKDDQSKSWKPKKKAGDKSFIYDDIPKAAEKDMSLTKTQSHSISNADKSTHVERL